MADLPIRWFAWLAAVSLWQAWCGGDASGAAGRTNIPLTTPWKAEKGVIARILESLARGMSGFRTMNVKKTRTAGAIKIQKHVHKAVMSAKRAGSYDRPAPAELACWVEKARNLPEVRQDLVDRIKSEIADGAYETPEKIQIAAERLLEEIS
ncbi:MAG: flagellar biosynthesis anti-sigma factor FlgM [Phycisphaerae bacterium]|nr:flagellar biosynthesis anti-sigma factor FlgM [Phycisphaerae bacterium]